MSTANSRTDLELLDLISQTTSGSPTKQGSINENSTVQSQPENLNVSRTEETKFTNNIGNNASLEQPIGQHTVIVKTETWGTNLSRIATTPESLLTDDVAMNIGDTKLKDHILANEDLKNDGDGCKSNAEGSTKDESFKSGGTEEGEIFSPEKNSNEEIGQTKDLCSMTKDELISEVTKCHVEVETVKKQLLKTERQMEKTNDYSEVLRNMVEKLSGELHRYKHSKTRSIHVQVDTNELLLHSIGQYKMPSWDTDVRSMDMETSPISSPAAPSATTANKSEPEPMMSIADSIKACVSEVLQKQTSDTMVQSGYIMDTNSGLYYHPTSGYYYDAEKSLYYQPNTGTYYYFDFDTEQYKFHSQIDLSTYNFSGQQQAQTQSRPNQNTGTFKAKIFSPEQKGKGVNKKKQKKSKSNKAEDEALKEQMDTFLLSTQIATKKHQPGTTNTNNQDFKNRKERRQAEQEQADLRRLKREQKRIRKELKRKDKKSRKHRSRDRRKKKKRQRNDSSASNTGSDDKGRNHSRSKSRSRNKSRSVSRSKSRSYSRSRSRSNLGSRSRSGCRSVSRSASESPYTSRSLHNSNSHSRSPFNDRSFSSQSDDNINTRDKHRRHRVKGRKRKRRRHSHKSRSRERHYTSQSSQNSDSKAEIRSSEDSRGKQNSKVEDAMTLGYIGHMLNTDDEMESEHDLVIDEGLDDENELDEKNMKINKMIQDNVDSSTEDLNVFKKGIVTVVASKDDPENEFKEKLKQTTTVKGRKEKDSSDLNKDENHDRRHSGRNKSKKERNHSHRDDKSSYKTYSRRSDNNAICVISSGEGELSDSCTEESPRGITKGHKRERIDTDTTSDSTDTESSDWSYNDDSDGGEQGMIEDNQAEDDELAGQYPPCIRVIVLESECVDVGMLYIATCAGATIGRDKDMHHDIFIQDISISKLHAEIHYCMSSRQYEIVDKGSQNGTLVNGQRISQPKETSNPYPINHGDNVQVGNTKLLCHIHNGSDTCDDCEPGIVMAKHRAQQPVQEVRFVSKAERLKQQKVQMNQLKKKYGLKNSAYEDNQEVFNNPQYEDKAAERRKTVGSECPAMKHEAPATVHKPIASGNIGHKMLMKMGWKEGDSLGKDNSGIQEPIMANLRTNQSAGLGSGNAGVFSVEDANSVDVRKANRRVQAQLRFQQIQNAGDNIPGTNTDVKHKQEKQLWTKGETQYKGS